MQWLRITGEIILLDPRLTSHDDIEDFFDREGIIARRYIDGDTWNIELPISEKNALAIVCTDGNIREGMSIHAFVKKISESLRKIQVNLDHSVVAWGQIDIGKVDVEDEGDTSLSYSKEVKSFNDNESHYYVDGSMVCLSDVVLAKLTQLPSYIDAPVYVGDISRGHVVVPMNNTPISVDVHELNENMWITLSIAHDAKQPPLISVYLHGCVHVWNWNYLYTNCTWMDRNGPAAQFAHEHMGAGFFCSAFSSLLDVSDPQKLRALLETKDIKSAHLIMDDVCSLLNIPSPTNDAEQLSARGVLENFQVFVPQDFTDRLKTTIAYEVSGEGSGSSRMWKWYRRFYVEHPLLVSVMTTGHIATGAFVLARRVRKNKHTALSLMAGISLIVSALVQASTAVWVRSLLKSIHHNDDDLS
ncbi:MAG: hypothetical protein J6M18_00275 [Actinomycetaceae bacterium]|nr:hypothetical protein [Actinomycetaceae bacterium]